MKIFLKMYARYNLGDDLFLNIFSKRYTENITIISNEKYEKFENINVKYNLFYRGINKIIKKVSNNKYGLENLCMRFSDITVLLGGSMFIEKKFSQPKYKIGSGKNYYIIGSNFGPYKTEIYKKYFGNVFAKAQDVCFRDKYSYNLFKDLPNVRQASDIVFSLKTDNINITNNRKVVISVIDCAKKVKETYAQEYEEKIIKLIEFFRNKNYDVVVMSFCEAEGDETAINNILDRIPNKEKVSKYFYRGDIDEALNVIGDSQIVVGTRFHANILGLVMNKTVIPIAYSDKTLNVLKDMNFKGKVFDIRDMDNFDVDSLTDEDLNYKLDVSYQIKDAERHFEVLDKVLERKEEND